jgi:quinol monooxygenase YgiN
MAYYAIGERRVRPGEMEAFVQATRQFGEQIARAGAPQEAFQLYVAEDDPEIALLVGRWPHPDRMAAAHAAVPREMADAARVNVLSGGGVWRWYAPVREVEAFGERTRVLVAAQFTLDPGETEAFMAWARAVQDRLVRVEGVVATRLLVAVDDPRSYAYLGEYGDDQVVHAVRAATADIPGPPELKGWRRFAGRVGYWWDRPGQRDLE